MQERGHPGDGGPGRLTVFLCGDVMMGRGIDQALPHPSEPHLYEPYVTDAREYVALAEAVNGPFRRPMGLAEPWGEALMELERVRPDVRLINLETSVTTSEAYWPGKGIHYRMHPRNVGSLTAARVDCCALANNHVLDWGYEGLHETLAVLRGMGVVTAGAGADAEEAERPAVLEVPGRGRVVVVSYGTEDSGVPPDWAARPGRAGVAWLPELTRAEARRVGARVEAVKRRGDVFIASVHWGSNWGYAIEPEQRDFAHWLIDEAGVDVVHGHSSHHPRGIEVYRERPILYGCGDFLNDYEGIRGYESFRGELTLMYFVSVDARSGRLESLRMTPMRIRHFRLERASREDARWLGQVLTREGARWGTRVRQEEDGTLALEWG